MITTENGELGTGSARGIPPLPRRLIVYAKRPLTGHAKTRLGAGIGAEAAAGVYARLLYEYLADLLRAPIPDTAVELAVAAPEDVDYFAHAFPEWSVVAQVEGDLGTRMAASFRRAFEAGMESVVLTGSDAPELDANLLREAFAKLDTAPGTRLGVIGPALDGGYYLLGMRAPGADLFQDVAWSTSKVLAQTEVLAQAAGIELAHLPLLSDIDTAEDYEVWRRSLLAERQESQRMWDAPNPRMRQDVRNEDETHSEG